jgi:hypothetical protein
MESPAPTSVAEPAGPPRDGRFAHLRGNWPLIVMIGGGLLLCAAFAYSQTIPPLPFGHFTHPPIYGVWKPVLDSLALIVVPAGAALAAAAWTMTSSRRVPTWLALALIIACGVATAAAIGLVRGDAGDLVRGVSVAPTSPYYASDLHFVQEYGVRGFAMHHPELVRGFHAYNSKTHPPGVLLLLNGVFQLLGGSHTLRIATLLALMSMCAAIAAWSMGRTLAGERSGRIAAALFVAAPGPLMLAYTTMDAVFATVLAAAVALFMVAAHRQSARIAAVAGAVLAAATVLTYAAAFVALAAGIAVAVQSPNIRSALRLLGAAAAAGLGVLVLARFGLGYDLLASYQSSPKAGRPYNPYWIIGSPLACLIYAGLPLATIGVVGLFRKVPGSARQILPAVLVLLMVVWAALPPEFTKLRPGEVERTWAFLYPVLAATAAPIVDRWSSRAGRWSGAVVAGLVALSVGQAVAVQALWDNLS